MSEADWTLLEGTRASWRKPRRELVATDGQKLTLGGTTLTLHITPGHTLGTISTLIPVLDGGTRHVAAYWGGTAFNWVANRAAYITPERPDSFWFNNYIQSAQRFRTLAKNAGADVILSNHTAFDGSKTKLPAMATRRRRSASVRRRHGFGRAVSDRRRRVREGRTAADEVTRRDRRSHEPRRRPLPQLRRSAQRSVLRRVRTTVGPGQSHACRKLAGDAWQELSGYDGRIAATFRGLLHPGRLTLEYLQGRRARYLLAGSTLL